MNSISTRITEGCGKELIRVILSNGFHVWCGNSEHKNGKKEYCSYCREVAKASLERCEEARNRLFERSGEIDISAVKCSSKKFCWFCTEYNYYESEIKILKDCEGLIDK